MLYVLSNTYREFAKFIHERGLRNGKDARYVQDDRAYRGRRGDTFALVGKYQEKVGYVRYIDEMMMADFTCVYREDHLSPPVQAYRPDINSLMRRSNLHFSIGQLLTGQ